MKKRILLFIALSLLFVPQTFAAESSSYYLFKYHMHKLFDDYNRAQINLTLKKYDVAGIYLKHLLENIDNVKNYYPEKDKEKVRINRERFNQTLNELARVVSEMKGSIDKGAFNEAKKLSQDTLNICIGCHHEESKLKYLFTIPKRSTPLFGEYMHKLREYTDLARIYMDEKEKEKAEENLKLISYYIDRLEETFPDAGPSGVIVNKEDFKNRLKEAKKVNEDMLNNVIEKKTANVELFCQYLNGFCVACHAPGRMR